MVMTYEQKLAFLDKHEDEAWEQFAADKSGYLARIELCQRVRAGLKAEREAVLRWRKNPEGKWQFA